MHGAADSLSAIRAVTLDADYDGARQADWPALLLADSPPRPDVRTVRNWKEAGQALASL